MRILLLILLFTVSARASLPPERLAEIEKNAVVIYTSAIIGNYVSMFFWADGRKFFTHSKKDTLIEGRANSKEVMRIVRLAKALNFTAESSGFSGLVPDAWRHTIYKVNAPSDVTADSAGAVGLSKADIMRAIDKLSGFSWSK